MKARLIMPDGTETVKEWPGEPPYEDMKEFVGGYIELVTVLNGGKRCHMIVNEEGMILGLPINDAATEVYYAASRARGVEPTDDAQRLADSQAAFESLKKGLDPEGKGIAHINLCPPGAPKIHGPAMLLDGVLS